MWNNFKLFRGYMRQWSPAAQGQQRCAQLLRTPSAEKLGLASDEVRFCRAPLVVTQGPSSLRCDYLRSLAASGEGGDCCGRSDIASRKGPRTSSATSQGVYRDLCLALLPASFSSFAEMFPSSPL